MDTTLGMYVPENSDQGS